MQEGEKNRVTSVYPAVLTLHAAHKDKSSCLGAHIKKTPKLQFQHVSTIAKFMLNWCLFVSEMTAVCLSQLSLLSEVTLPDLCLFLQERERAKNRKYDKVR